MPCFQIFTQDFDRDNKTQLLAHAGTDAFVSGWVKTASFLLEQSKKPTWRDRFLRQNVRMKQDIVNREAEMIFLPYLQRALESSLALYAHFRALHWYDAAEKEHLVNGLFYSLYACSRGDGFFRLTQQNMRKMKMEKVSINLENCKRVWASIGSDCTTKGPLWFTLYDG